MQQSIWEIIKHRVKHGGMTMKLIAINVGVFLIISLFDIFGFLFKNEPEMWGWISYLTTGTTSFEDTLYRPWSIITNMFTHYKFLHLLGNMIMLYFAGSMLERFFGAKRVLFLHIAGGLAGFFINMAAHNLFPGLPDYIAVIGASGATTALVIALAAYVPQMQVMLFGVFPVKLYVIALALVALDFLSISARDNIAHFAHLGGALMGWLFIYFWKQGKDLSKPFSSGKRKFTNPFKRKPKLKVEYSKRRGEMQDDAFNRTKKERQEKIDAILDKIKYQGYGALSQAEKDFLNSESKHV